MNDNHVGYCRYLRNDNGEAYSIEICNSDDEGAFKVYRNSDRTLLEDMAEVLQKLYDHTKNNMQICGLNSIASSVLTRYDITRAKERLG